MKRPEKQPNAIEISQKSMALNLLLSLVKLAAGLLASSSAMISDAIHSASDVVSTLMVIVSVKLSSKKADADHEYGHERMESLAALLLSVLLVLTGLWIGYSGLKSLESASRGELSAPGVAALAAAVLSIVVKEWMFRMTRRAANALHSSALMADAWHHRSDALSSIGSLVGIAAARLGFPMGDPIASLIICALIVKAGVDIFMSAAAQLTDRACDPETEARMRNVIGAQEGVARIDLLQTRRFGAKIYADVEIAADGSLPLREAHEIAERVHGQIEQQFPDVKHCMVHVNPA